MSLPPGWYPRQKEKIGEFLEPFARAGAPTGQEGFAAIAPHAGWYYSGQTAAVAVASLDAAAETVVVIGGHLPRGIEVLIAPEDGVKTPLGTMTVDLELREEFKKQVSSKPDRYADNTVEVLLPMVHYFFPQSKLLWLRFPAEEKSFEAGKILTKTAADLGRRLVVLASTDLTHYGDNYGFSPMGRGRPALEWVKKVNDAAFIEAVLEGNPSLVLKRAEEDSSACSAGAVLGALGFAASNGETRANFAAKFAANFARLLEYRTSADVSPDDEVPSSFVGYAAISLG